jgi:hypothetical protein
MAPVEQKVYLAQVPANGGDPMVNLSGGPPAVHEDPRGFEVVRDLYGFLAEHEDHYEGDASGANAAIVYSLDTLFFFGQDQPGSRYVDEIRGIERALHEAHVPFDIISTRVLDEAVGENGRYRVLILPTLACMSEDEAAAMRRFVESGGSVVATFETSLYDRRGIRREGFLLSDLWGATYTGVTQSSMAGPEEGYKQVYMEISERHPILQESAGTSVLPMGGDYCVVSAAKEADVPLTLSAPFIVFPEGFSYPKRPASEDPLVVIREHESGGRTLYFSGRPGALYHTMPYPDLGYLIANAVTWAADGVLPVYVEGPPSLQVSIRTQPNRRLVHLINLTGGDRFFQELVPLRDVKVAVPLEEGEDVQRVYRLSDGVDLAFDCEDRRCQVTVPEIMDYDVVVFETA